MAHEFTSIDPDSFSVSFGEFYPEYESSFLSNDNVIISADTAYSGRRSSFARAWINGGDGEVGLGKEGLMILCDPSLSSGDQWSWDAGEYKQYFIADTNHILLARRNIDTTSMPFPYVLIYNGLEPGGTDIGPFGATSNEELKYEYNLLLRTNPNADEEFYTIETIEWDSIHTIMGVTEESISHITLDAIREVSYLLRGSGNGFNIGVTLDAQLCVGREFLDRSLDGATYTWYINDSIITGEEYRTIDTSVYGGGSYSVRIDYASGRYAGWSATSRSFYVGSIKGNIDQDDLEKVPSIHTIEHAIQKKVKTFRIQDPVAFASQYIDTVIVGTKKKDRITGTSDGEVLAGMKGKDVLKGGGGADGFLFNQPGSFGNKHVDQIKDFDSDEGDSILVDQDVFGLGKKIKLKSYNSKNTVKKAAKSKNDFVYDEKKGLLYFNENGKQKGWGDGGLFAKLQGAPELGADDFTIV